MYEPAAVGPRLLDDGSRAFDVEQPSHFWVELARFQGTVADAVQHRAKTERAKEIAQRPAVLGVHGHDPRTVELPGLPRPGAEHLTGITSLEVGQGVVPGDAGDACNQQWKRKGNFRQMVGEHVSHGNKLAITS